MEKHFVIKIVVKPTSIPNHFEIVDAASGRILGTMEPSNSSDVFIKGGNGRIANMPVREAFAHVFQDDVEIIKE
jgi:hypothetical protein